ncbi:hypothetical protein Bhyg_09201, partial [Pseudolycoriella hygida]
MLMNPNGSTDSVPIYDENLVSKVWKKNRRGEKRIVSKILCPFCCSAITPQLRTNPQCRATGSRWDITNFNRHLVKLHTEQPQPTLETKLN